MRGVWHLTETVISNAPWGYLDPRPIDAVQSIPAIAFVLYHEWRRRVWLRANGRRVDRALWDQAVPLS